MDTLGGSLENWAILGVISMYFFPKVKLQNGNFFGGC